MDITGDNWQVLAGSCLDRLPELPDNSIDAIVTDPPYELGFMGKSWDASGIAFNVAVWAECLRVLKPGGHLLAFSGTRTYHRMTVAIEDAGFEVRDMIAWISNKTFPKSHDIGKAIDKAAGAERENDFKSTTVRQTPNSASHRGAHTCNNCGKYSGSAVANCKCPKSKPVTDNAKYWDGWGTALKPSLEPVVMARKPLIGAVAQNVLEWSTGGINIDGTRIGTDTVTINTFDDGAKPWGNASGEAYTSRQSQGRWPSNVMLDEYTAELVDEQSDASRFFYVAKASKNDRNEGLDKLNQPHPNFHPTVKPTDLMRQLVKLVTPPGGIVLDPFTGSGSTGKATLLEGFQFIGVELTEDYLPIIQGRLEHAVKQTQPPDDALF